MIRPLILLLTALCLVTQNLSTEEYDLGSGCVFNEEGAGYEHSYCAPNFLYVTIGVLGSLAMIAGIIAIGNSSSSHPSDDTTPVPTPLPITLPEAFTPSNSNPAAALPATALPAARMFAPLSFHGG